MQYLKRLILLLFTIGTFLSCQSQDTRQDKEFRIEWDESSLVCIADEGAYPRLRRLNDGTLLAVYENRRGDVMVTSGTTPSLHSLPPTSFPTESVSG